MKVLKANFGVMLIVLSFILEGSEVSSLKLFLKRDLLRFPLVINTCRAMYQPPPVEALSLGLGLGYGSGTFSFLEDRCCGSSEFRSAGVAGFGAKQRIDFPDWMAGLWSVESTFNGVQYPKGIDYVPNFLRVGSFRASNDRIGRSVTIRQRFNPSVQLKSPLSSEYDRAFSTRSLLVAYNDPPIDNVFYNADKDPGSFTITYPSLSEDMQPLAERRTKVIISNLDSALGNDGRAFVFSESYRAVTLKAGNTAVADSETVTLLRRVSNGVLEGHQRIASFLTPSPNSREGVLFMDIGPTSIATSDWSVRWTRVDED